MTQKPDKSINTIDDYLAQIPDLAAGKLLKIRHIVKETMPEATEVISYGMPAFETKCVFIYFAAFKNHIGVYPPVMNDAKLIADLQPYRNEKGNLRFPMDSDVPEMLIRRIITALALQYTA